MEDQQRERERVERRHLREKKELQDRIQSMKNAVPKSDKKKRKQLLLDVERLEAELEQKHQQELEKFGEIYPDTSNLDAVAAGLAKMNIENRPPRLSKVQKRRERRAAQERERQKMAEEADMDYMSTHRRKEEEKLAAILAAKNLEMKYIPVDSHCMYRAIQDQLSVSETLESLRVRTANYMREHIDDFLPFFSDPETGDAYSSDDFLSYCDDIVHNASWGTQLELRALSHVLRCPIEVVQTPAPAFVVGEEYNEKPLILVYVRYCSSFGDHYNSVKPLPAGAVGGTAPRLF